MAGLTPPRPFTADDDRDSFDCGRDSLNHWLSTAQIRRAFLPKIADLVHNGF